MPALARLTCSSLYSARACRERREKIREEIISTERSYVLSLEVLENNFIKPLKAQGPSALLGFRLCRLRSILSFVLWYVLSLAFRLWQRPRSG